MSEPYDHIPHIAIVYRPVQIHVGADPVGSMPPADDHVVTGVGSIADGVQATEDQRARVHAQAVEGAAADVRRRRAGGEGSRGPVQLVDRLGQQEVRVEVARGERGEEELGRVWDFREGRQLVRRVEQPGPVRSAIVT